MHHGALCNRRAPVQAAAQAVCVQCRRAAPQVFAGGRGRHALVWPGANSKCVPDKVATLCQSHLPRTRPARAAATTWQGPLTSAPPTHGMRVAATRAGHGTYARCRTPPGPGLGTGRATQAAIATRGCRNSKRRPDSVFTGSHCSPTCPRITHSRRLSAILVSTHWRNRTHSRERDAYTQMKTTTTRSQSSEPAGAPKVQSSTDDSRWHACTPSGVHSCGV